MNPFDFSNAILTTKEDLLKENDEKEYIPYIVNRAISYYPDAIYHANMMNINHQIPKKQQFYYLLNSIRGSKRRYSKWAKPENSDDIKMIQEVYGYNLQRAREALRILTPEQIDMIRKNNNKGGVVK